VHARRAVELSPKDGNCHSILALAEYRSGHWNESLAAAERSIELRKGGDALNGFILAMAHWQKGDKDRARALFDDAAARMTQNPSRNKDLRRLWTEAAELTGRPGPDAVGPTSPPAPTEKRPR
jgi:Flp pilus assembly protein TadD